MLNEEIAGLVGGLRSSSNSSVAAFARMEQKVEQLEAEAAAAGQLGVCALVATHITCMWLPGTLENNCHTIVPVLLQNEAEVVLSIREGGCNMGCTLWIYRHVLCAGAATGKLTSALAAVLQRCAGEPLCAHGRRQFRRR